MTSLNNWFVIPLTLLAALVLTMLPMPVWAIWFRPAWVLLIVIYWNLIFPDRVGILSAWMMGIILDMLNGSALGEHALAMTIVSYLVIRMHTRLRMFPLLQQGFTVLLLVLLYQFVIFCVQGFMGDLPRGWLYWASAITSMLLWPWVFTIMRDLRRRFRIV